jgi:3-deoxy-D-manno-octulosonate 8-phosphate phosphatase (KDO 8-P phosphatase)
MNQDLIERARKIKLLLMDCDGVLTDGRLYFGQEGENLKVFHVRDGQGIVSWHKAGFASGIISGRNSKIVERRANELGIKFIRQGSTNKLSDFEEILQETNLTAAETAYIGDDTPDLPLLKAVGLSSTVADAAQEVFSNVHLVLQNKGGNGAVRELIDLLLEAQANI